METKESKFENKAFADVLGDGDAGKSGGATLKRAVEILVKAGERAAEPEEEVVVIAMPSAAEIKKIGLKLDDEEWADLRKKAQDEKEAADAVGRKLFETREKLHQIESDFTLKETSIGETILAALRKDLAKLKGYGDEYFQKRAEGFALVEEIRAIDPAHIEKVREIYARVVALGHRQLITKTDIDKAARDGKRFEGLIFFEGKISVSVLGCEKNGFYRALEAELRKLTDKAKRSKAAVIAAVSPDLNGYGHGKPGVYQFVSPYHKEEDGREYFEGRAIVKLFDVNRDRGSRPYIKADITKATGSLGWAENQPGKRPIPLDWIRDGEIPHDEEKKMTFEQVKYAKKAISNLHRIYGNWKKGLNPGAAKPKEEKSEGPAVNPVADTDMSGVVVETKPVTAVKAEKTEKPKKVKKTTTNPNEEVK